MTEEEVFWLMAVICEDIVPEYYRPQMVIFINNLSCKFFFFLVISCCGVLLGSQKIPKKPQN